MKTFTIIMTCLCVYTSLQAQQPTNKTTPKAASESSAEDCNSNKRNPKDNFGEDSSTYGPHDIVYVYDFNKDPSKRRFYKITKNGNTLETNPVNFNREVIHHRDNVKFKIYHLNKFMYHASIADTVVTFDSEANVLFANFFQGEGDFMESLMNNFSSTLMNKALDRTLVQKNEFASTDDPESNKIQIDSLLVAKIQRFVKDYNTLQEEILQAYNPCDSFDCCNDQNHRYTELANLLSEIRIETAEIQRELNEKKAFTAPCIEAGNILKNQKDKIKDLTLKSLQITAKTQLLDKEKGALNEKINLSRGQEKKKQEANLAQIKEELLTKQNELKTIENESQEAKKELELLEEKVKDACDKDAEITKKHLKELTAAASGASYHWLNCATNQLINGAINASFTPTESGSYAVIVTQNGCSDTSACLVVTTVGVTTLTQNEWTVYPNPATEVLFIEAPEATAIEMMDMTGKIVQRENLEAGKNELSISTLTRGVYVIRSVSGWNVRFVKN